MSTSKWIKAIVFTWTVICFFTVNGYAKIDLVTLTQSNAVQTTIYKNADLTLVRDYRLLNFVKGTNELQFSWANTKIDPTSLTLEIQDHSSKDIAGKINITRITYPPGTKNRGIWKIQAKTACKVPVQITYFTSGISWDAYYIARLSESEKTCDITGYVKVSNHSGEDYTRAKTRLVVGKIHVLDTIADLAAHQFPYGRPQYLAAREQIKAMESPRAMMAMDSSSMVRQAPKKIMKEGLSEFFIYTIDGEETIPHGWSKRLLSFEANDVRVENLYRYDEQKFHTNVMRFLMFRNDKKNNLGTTPLPGGQVKVFQHIGDNGELDYIGADSTKFIPVGKVGELNLGSSLKVKIEPITTSYKKTNLIFDKKGNIIGFEELKKMELRMSNFTGTQAALEYIKHLPSSQFKFSELSHPEAFEKTDKNTIKFLTQLAPQSEQTISFTLTTFRGERK